jgi:protein involved in ribonucleotide reduction
LKDASIDELHKIKKIFISEKYNNDVCQDIEKLVEAIIEKYEDYLANMDKTIIAEDIPDDRIGTGINRELKQIVDKANTQYRANLTNDEMKQIIHEFVINLMELIEDKSRDDLINAYQFTLYTAKINPSCPVKPGYDEVSKILDDVLENKGISRDSCGVVISGDRNFGTPYKRWSMRAGSYKKTKKRRMRPLKKSRRVKRRKTKTAKKTRKHRK